MAVPQQPPPRTAPASASCLLVVGLLCALQEPPPPPTPKRAPRPPQPLRTFDDVKLDLVEEGGRGPDSVGSTDREPSAGAAHDAPRARAAESHEGRLAPASANKQTNGAVTLVVAGHAHVELLMNWLVAYRRHSSNYIIGCLDTTLFDVLRQKNRCVSGPKSGRPPDARFEVAGTGETPGETI